MLTEFELIKHCFNWPQNNTDVIYAVGDDASIIDIPHGYQLVQSIDTQVADVHFPAQAPACLIAQRALRCAISDLAAMGARPQAFHLALSLPKQTTQQWLESFSSGLRDCAQEYRIDLIGGDTTSSPTLTITLQVQGLVPSHKALQRNQAQIGDDIWLSGEIGRSAAALSSILSNPTALINNDKNLASAYYYPDAQVALGQKLIGLANSAMDISDGLLQDASHISKASQVTLDIESQSIPLNEISVNQFGRPDALQFALTGGDDYQLLFTAPASAYSKIEELGCTKIGRVIPLCDNKNNKQIETQWVLLDGESVQNKTLGYQHF